MVIGKSQLVCWFYLYSTVISHELQLGHFAPHVYVLYCMYLVLRAELRQGETLQS